MIRYSFFRDIVSSIFLVLLSLSHFLFLGCSLFSSEKPRLGNCMLSVRSSEGDSCCEGISKHKEPGQRHSSWSCELDDRRLTLNQESSCGKLAFSNFVAAKDFQLACFARRLRRIRASLRAWYEEALSLMSVGFKGDATTAGAPEGASKTLAPSVSDAMERPVLDSSWWSPSVGRIHRNGQRSLDSSKEHAEDVLVLHDKLGIAVRTCQSGGLEASSLMHLPSQLFHVVVGGLETAKDANLLLLHGRLHQHPSLSQTQEKVISLVLVIPVGLLALGRVLVVVDEVVNRRVAFLSHLSYSLQLVATWAVRRVSTEQLLVLLTDGHAMDYLRQSPDVIVCYPTSTILRASHSSSDRLPTKTRYLTACYSIPRICHSSQHDRYSAAAS
ncbi:hypothetical protein KCU76_g87, partial [Aureobasidium melanogenum]